VDEYLSEKEQIQQIRGWWNEHGAYIIAGLVIGVMGLTAWNYWQNFKTARAENASVEYQSLVMAVDGGDAEAAGRNLETLRTDYAMTPYLGQGRLMMARLAAEQNDLAAAAEQLRFAITETSDSELGHVARTRLSRVLLATGDTEGALAVLELSQAGVFVSRYHELRGDIFVYRGEMESAREEYAQALSSASAGVVNVQEVQMKLDALAPVPSVVEEIVDEAVDEADADS
jgi:predicted negative regulator of RcsB-dependent stress response